MDVLLHAAHALMPPYYFDEKSIPNSVIPWIQKAPHLRALSMSGSLFNPELSLTTTNWEPFTKTLERASLVREVTIVIKRVKWNGPETAPGYIHTLKAIVPPNVSVFLKTISSECESQSSLIEIV